MGFLGCAEAGPGFDPEEVAAQSSELSAYASQVLLITHPTVVDNNKTRVPNGYRVTDPCSAVAGDEDRPWNIGHMLKREAEKNNVTPTSYVTKWLDAWTTSGGSINGQTISVSDLEGPAVRAAWSRLGGESRLEKAPFKLLAIVNRIDLRTVRPFGEPLGGEIRFVFAPLVVPSSGAIPCPSRASDVSTIILEYSPAKANENAVLDWAQRWHALGTMTLDTGTYRAALAVLTEEVINSGRLLRIRTNEGPTGLNWKLTEFEHDPTTKYLKRSTIKQSPTEALHTQSSVSLGRWIRDNEEQLQGTQPVSRTFRRGPIKTYIVPDKFPGTGTWLRGSFNHVRGDGINNFWNATNPGMSQSAWETSRHLFSLATCSGCHGNETGTGFLHIKNNPNGGAAELSSFLAGSHTVTDPVTGASRQFNEMARREEDLSWLITGGWVGVPVLRNEHADGQSAATAYKMVFGHSNKCLDVQGFSQSDNALVKQYACHGQGNQRVILVDKGQSVLNLIVKHSGKCLDVENASSDNLAKVVQKTCNDSPSQRLAMWFSGSQTARIVRFEHSGKCLRVLSNSTGEGAQVVQDVCDSSSSDQRAFRFVE